MKLPSNGVSFFVRECAMDRCVCTAQHRSGLRPLPIGPGQLIFDQGIVQAIGEIEAVDQADQVTPETWVYRITYRPLADTEHALWQEIKWAGPVRAGQGLDKATGQATGGQAGPLAVPA